MARRFSAEEIIKVRELTAQKVPGATIARLMQIDSEVFKKIAAFHEIELYTRNYDTKRRDDWIREWYPSMLTSVELVQKYREDIDPAGTKSHIYDRASKLKVHRPMAVIERERLLRFAEIGERNRARVNERLAKVQTLLDEGTTVKQAATRVGISHVVIYAAIKRGDVRYTPPAQSSAGAVKKTRVAGSYQTVEAWLAAGNQITRCPTAAAHYTTGYISPEDRQALSEHAYGQIQEGNMWKAARRAHFDAVDRMAGKANG